MSFFFRIGIILLFVSCGSRTMYQKIIDKRLDIPYHVAFLENIIPNCDSAMIFSLNNVYFDKREFLFEPSNHVHGFVNGVKQGCGLFPLQNFNPRSDILMYFNPQCFSDKSLDYTLDLFFEEMNIKGKLKIEQYIDTSKSVIVVSFPRIDGILLVNLFRNKAEYGVMDQDNSTSHGPARPKSISIVDAYLENRTLNCDSAYIYSKRNIKPLKINSKINNFSKTAQAKIYIPGIDPSQSKLKNLEKAQLERLFIRLDCLVGIPSSEIFDMFCVKEEIPKYQKWESQWGIWKKQLQIKFKGFPSKGIYVEFDDGMAVNSGMIE